MFYGGIAALKVNSKTLNFTKIKKVLQLNPDYCYTIQKNDEIRRHMHDD